jgi:hypothetical protein
VLGAPLTFVLSQDQTLQKEVLESGFSGRANDSVRWLCSIILVYHRLASLAGCPGRSAAAIHGFGTHESKRTIQFSRTEGAGAPAPTSDCLPSLESTTSVASLAALLRVARVRDSASSRRRSQLLFSSFRDPKIRSFKRTLLPHKTSGLEAHQGCIPNIGTKTSGTCRTARKTRAHTLVGDTLFFERGRRSTLAWARCPALSFLPLTFPGYPEICEREVPLLEAASMGSHRTVGLGSPSVARGKGFRSLGRRTLVSPR